jgi:uncharacterized protein YxjI
MRYVMKQKLFSWGDDFIIKDENGNDCYFVDGKVFSLGDKLSFQDMARNELAFISQRLLSWGPTYEISRDGQVVATVKKKLFTLLRCKFFIDVPGPNDLEARGNFLDREYQFYRGETVVATCSKKWFTWTDTYGVEVNPGEDPVLILASSTVIDMVCHADDQKHR